MSSAKHHLETAQKEETSALKLVVLVACFYTGNTVYNIYNKKAANQFHAHWFLASAQLALSVCINIILWTTGLRKKPNLTTEDLIACFRIGFFACLAHCGTLLAAAVGTVTFQQIIKACEPVFAAAIGIMIPPAEYKPPLAYMMLLVIVGGVGLACIKEGKGVDINYKAFMFASMANAAASLRGKLGSTVTNSLKGDPSKNMDAANVFGVMNIMSLLCTIPFVVFNDLPTLKEEWNSAVEAYGIADLLWNILISGLCFYIDNECHFAITAQVGVVTSSALNTAKRVIVISVSSIIFAETMARNTIIGSAIAISGTFAYSLASRTAPATSDKKAE